MTCPLTGHIGVTSRDLSSIDVPDAGVRVQYRGHDIIVLNTAIPLWDRWLAVGELTRPAERQLLLWQPQCSCTRGLKLMSA